MAPPAAIPGAPAVVAPTGTTVPLVSALLFAAPVTELVLAAIPFPAVTHAISLKLPSPAAPVVWPYFAQVA